MSRAVPLVREGTFKSGIGSSLFLCKVEFTLTLSSYISKARNLTKRNCVARIVRVITLQSKVSRARSYSHTSYNTLHFERNKVRATRNSRCFGHIVGNINTSKTSILTSHHNLILPISRIGARVFIKLCEVSSNTIISSYCSSRYTRSSSYSSNTIVGSFKLS